MQAKELRGKSENELKKLYLEQKKNLEKIMNDVYKGKEKNLSKAKFARKDIAKLMTVFTEQKIIKEVENA